jgi:hypothetical protein
MKEIWKSAGKAMFSVFVLALLVWAANLTYTRGTNALSLAMPSPPIWRWRCLTSARWRGCILLCTARAEPQQRTTAMILTVFDLVGVIVMSAGGFTCALSLCLSPMLLDRSNCGKLRGVVRAFKLYDPETQEANSRAEPGRRAIHGDPRAQERAIPYRHEADKGHARPGRLQAGCGDFTPQLYCDQEPA